MIELGGILSLLTLIIFLIVGYPNKTIHHLVTSTGIPNYIYLTILYSSCILYIPLVATKPDKTNYFAKKWIHKNIRCPQCSQKFDANITANKNPNLNGNHSLHTTLPLLQQKPTPNRNPMQPEIQRLTKTKPSPQTTSLSNNPPTNTPPLSSILTGYGI